MGKINRVKIITYFQREVYKKRSFKIKDIIEKFLLKHLMINALVHAWVI